MEPAGVCCGVPSRAPVRGSRSVRGTDLLGFAVTSGFLVAVLLVAVPALRLPAHVDEVTIDNPHEWPASVEVTDQDRDGWVGVGTVGREIEHGFLEVVDQGEIWIFRFSYAGKAVELRVVAPGSNTTTGRCRCQMSSPRRALPASRWRPSHAAASDPVGSDSERRMDGVVHVGRADPPVASLVELLVPGRHSAGVTAGR